MFGKEIINIDVDIENIAENRLLRHILHHVRRIDRKPHEQNYATQISQVQIGGNMATNFSVQAGGPPAVVQFIPTPAGSVFFTPTSFTPTADDPLVQLVPNPGDTTGTEWQITVPPTDTATSFNLAVSGPDGAAGATISGTQAWTIIPAVVPPVLATGIGQQQLS